MTRSNLATRRTRRPTLPGSAAGRLLAVLGALLALAPGFACGGGSSGEGGGGGGGTANIDVFDFGFKPATQTVKVGQKVTWTSTGQTTHNVTGPNFFSGGLEPGKSYTFVPRKAGSFPYQCTLHPQQMKGTLIVKS
jgi:plastocyanin